MKDKFIYIIFAILAAVFYALNIPISKFLLNNIGSTLLAGLLYFGAGLGIGIIFYINRKKIKKVELLDEKDLPYTVLMVCLDIIAPILLLYGLNMTSAGNVSLLNNFEIVATSIIALFIFKEFISWKLWIAIVLVTISSIILSFEDISAFTFSKGSIFVLLATICWGLENNCTRKISHKNTYEIVTIKGFGSGIGSLIIGVIIGERVDGLLYIIPAILLGFVAYGLSIFLYIKAQNGFGATKTSVFYAVNPFIATTLSIIIFNERFTWNYGVALIIMILGTAMIIYDMMSAKQYKHTHHITHTHDRLSHTHIITHTHLLVNFGNMKEHTHTNKELLEESH